MNTVKENMKHKGWTHTNFQLNAEEIDFFREEVEKRFHDLHQKYTDEQLVSWHEQDIVKCMFRFEEHWINLLSSDSLNNLVNELLNDVAVLYDAFGLNNTGEFSSRRSEFHRDQLYLGLRASVLLTIPLVDFTEVNGATEIVPSTHLIEQKPSDEFCEENKIALTAKAGECVAIDASLWHRAGKNLSGKPRPALILRYQLPFLKRSIDLCEVYKNELPNSSEIIKQRMGWNCRENKDIENLYSYDKNTFHTGQYKTEGLYL